MENGPIWAATSNSQKPFSCELLRLCLFIPWTLYASKWSLNSESVLVVSTLWVISFRPCDINSVQHWVLIQHDSWKWNEVFYHVIPSPVKLPNVTLLISHFNMIFDIKIFLLKRVRLKPLFKGSLPPLQFPEQSCINLNPHTQKRTPPPPRIIIIIIICLI